MFSVQRTSDGSELQLQIGKTPKSWMLPKGLAKDEGTYELIEGSVKQGRLNLFFEGKKLKGEYQLTKTDDGWQLWPKKSSS